MRQVLFLCTGNSARSQMAEAILRQQAGDLFEVTSAGTAPEPIHPLTLETLSRHGYATAGLTSKALTDLPERHYDFIVSLCDKAHQECERFPGAADIIAWHIADPRQRNTEAAFNAALKDIADRISMFLLVQKRQPHGFDRIKFFKALAEPHRLTALLLISQAGELCVCELVQALAEPQPKVSRYLAELKASQLVAETRRGQWIYYRLSPALPTWARAVINATDTGNQAWLAPALQRLGSADTREPLCG